MPLGGQQGYGRSRMEGQRPPQIPQVPQPQKPPQPNKPGMPGTQRPQQQQLGAQRPSAAQQAQALRTVGAGQGFPPGYQQISYQQAYQQAGPMQRQQLERYFAEQMERQMGITPRGYRR